MCTQRCPPGPASCRDAGDGEMQPVPATGTYPAQLLAEPCAGTVLQQPQRAGTASVLSQAWPAERQLLEERFLH